MLNPDFTLSATSSAINAGDNSLISGYTTDLLGNPRIVGGTVDMGAYEFELCAAGQHHAEQRQHR